MNTLHKVELPALILYGAVTVSLVPMVQQIYRMIAIDLDGTLLSPQSTVSQRTKAAVHQALDAGLLVCFATGRNWTESRAILDTVEHYDKAVFVGGAMVVDTNKEVTLHRTLMAPQLARDVCAALESMGHAVLVLQDTNNGGCEYLVSGDIELDESTVKWMAVTESTVKRVGRLSRYEHDHTIRVGIVASPDLSAGIKAKLEETFGKRILCQMLMAIGYGVHVMEVFDPAVNKWQGILHVAAHHGVRAEEIIAIGDDINDLTMIRNEGMGVAMGNARAEVKAAAKRIIGTNSEDGLAIFLEELVAEHKVLPAPQGD